MPTYYYTTINGAFPSGSNISPFGINDAGEIVGTYTDSGGTSHGFTYLNGTESPFDVGSTFSAVHGVNDSGHLVGEYRWLGWIGRSWASATLAAAAKPT